MKPGHLQTSIALARQQLAALLWFVPCVKALPWLLSTLGRHHPWLESILLLQSHHSVVASQLKSRLGHGWDAWPVSSSGPAVVCPAPVALPGWGGGLKSMCLVLLGGWWLYLSGVLHHAGGERRGALWKGTVQIRKQWDCVEKYSGWEHFAENKWRKNDTLCGKSLSVGNPSANRKPDFES